MSRSSHVTTGLTKLEYLCHFQLLGMLMTEPNAKKMEGVASPLPLLVKCQRLVREDGTCSITTIISNVVILLVTHVALTLDNVKKGQRFRYGKILCLTVTDIANIARA
jgi:hypothetical protein